MNSRFSLQALVIFLITGVFFLLLSRRYTLFSLPKEKAAWKEDLSLISPLFALLLYFFGTGPVTAFTYRLCKETYPLCTPSLIWASSFFVGISFSFITLVGLISFHSKVLKKRILGAGNCIIKLLQGMFLAVGVYPVAVAAVGIMNFLLFYCVGHEPREEQVAVILLKNLPRTSPLFSIALLFALGVVPVVEEFLFRGFIQNYLVRFCSYRGAIFLTSLIFSFFHYSSSQGFMNISLLLGLCITSLFIGAVYVRYGSIWTAIGLHAMFNAISMLFLFI
jgi:membrane protease YdiL (CAAX protease family)